MLIKTWVQTWEISIQDWRLKILQDSSWRIFNPGLKLEDSPGLFLENLQFRIEAWRFSRTLLGESSIFRIEDWKFSRTLLGESSIQDWSLKILQDSSWRIFNSGLKLEDSPGLFLENLQSSGLKIEDSPGLFLGNLQSRIEDWKLEILQDSSWRIFKPGLKIEDWKFSRPFLGESSVQDWGFNIKGSLLDWRFSKKSPGGF